MSFYRGMTCENVTITGDGGTPITAYVAKPSGPAVSVVLIPSPHWSELYIETTHTSRYLAICANLYERAGEGNPDVCESARRRRHSRRADRSAIPRRR